jgi:hypothetical protein
MDLQYFAITYEYTVSLSLMPLYATNYAATYSYSLQHSRQTGDFPFFKRLLHSASVKQYVDSHSKIVNRFFAAIHEYKAILQFKRDSPHNVAYSAIRRFQERQALRKCIAKKPIQVHRIYSCNLKFTGTK